MRDRSIHSDRARFVLLDRDGVINRRIPGGYVNSWEKFEFLPRVLESLQLLSRYGFAALVVSNQACVGKGLLSFEQLQLLTERFVREIAANGGDIRGVYYCPHTEQQRCVCRKPAPGLLLQAQREHGLDFSDTFVIGDSESDLEAAQRVGSPSVLVSSGVGPLAPRLRPSAATVKDLYEAVEFILGVRAMDLRTTAPLRVARPVPISTSRSRYED